VARRVQRQVGVSVSDYLLEFFEDPGGDQPVRRWLKEELSPTKRRALGYAMSEVLQRIGVSVCGTELGRQLGQGLFEFRLRANPGAISSGRGRSPPEEAVLLRVFCHAHGDRAILLLGGYDKGEHPSRERQSREIARARARLADWRARRRRRG